MYGSIRIRANLQFVASFSSIVFFVCIVGPAFVVLLLLVPAELRMKRRVQKGKEAKKALRWHQTALRLSAPYDVLVDASFARAARAANCSDLAALTRAPFDGPVTLYVNAATSRVLESTDAAAAALLSSAKTWDTGVADKERNEHKALLTLLKSSQTHVFLATVSHDLRQLVAGVRNVSALTLTYTPLAVRINMPSTAGSAGDAAAAPVVRDKDRAFIAAKGGQVREAPKAAREPAAGTSADAPVVARVTRRAKPETSAPNSLSRRPKREREAYVSADLE